MKITQTRTCPLCLSYMQFRGWEPQNIDQVRTFREGRKPTLWRHTSRMGKFIHGQAEKSPVAAEVKPA